MTTNRKFRWLRRHPHVPLYGACLFFALMAMSVKLLTSSVASAPEWMGEHELPAVEVAFFRSFLCLLMLVPVLWRREPSEKTSPLLSKALFMRSLAGGLAMICYFEAISKLSLANAVLLNYTSPLWASLFAWVWLRERLSLSVVLAYPLALLGIILVVGAPGGSSDWSGYVLGLSSAVLAGAAYTALRGLRQTSPVVVVGGLCAVTSLLTAPLCWSVYRPPTTSEWLLLLLCAASSALAQLMLTLGFRWSSTASASTVGMATVASTWVLSWIVLGESLTLHQTMGLVVLLCATSQTSANSMFGRAMQSLLSRPRIAH